MGVLQFEKVLASRGANGPCGHCAARRLVDPALRARYDAAAPYWHRQMRRFDYPRAYTRLFAWLRDAGWLRSLDVGGRVLECGIGTGVVSLALARVAPVREVVGVDIAPRMLRQAAANLAAASITAELHCADAHRLAQGDGSFDAAVTAHMLEHLACPREAIAEMARVLRPGAPLVIVMTRGGLADALVRLKWRHARIAGAQLIAWMRAVRLENIAAHDIGDALSPARWLSRVFVGRKS
ncbi:MAG TPA: class I SAM-dependent methyltransferase [Burkholderiaceae bacterium]|nr:class I SAM-dependent methyltransferase [Burkholderiaceae bacterium]